MYTKSPYLKAVKIWKGFPGVIALKDVSLECFPGEVLGLVGENGAGKSTLMKIFSGFYKPDKGELYIESQEVEISNPLFAQKLGINMVYQDTRLVPDLTVMQNIWLGHEPTNMVLIDYNKMYQESRSLLDRFQININLNAYVKDLNTSQKQMVEIVKALSHKTKLLILDEPTSALTPNEAKKLFDVLVDIKKQGTSILFISHRIPEVLTICDRISVLKDGEMVGTVDNKNINEGILIKMMVGREISKLYGSSSNLHKDKKEEIFRVSKLSNHKYFHDISFRINKGEILGIFGIQGNGQREIVRSLAGLLPYDQGEIYLNENKIYIKNPGVALKEGIAYLSNDRRGESIASQLSIRDNMAMPNLKTNLYPFGFINPKKEEYKFQNVINQLRIKLTSLYQPIEQLSGGNQQKVAFASRYLQNPKVFIFDDPTIGVDVGSKSEIYSFIKELAENGVAVIVVSNDLPEIIGLCTRILVVSGGKIVKEVDAGEATEENIVGAAVTGSQNHKEGILNKNTKHSNVQLKNIMERWSSSFFVGVFIILLSLFAHYQSKYFLSADNLSNLILQLVPLGLVALGQSFAILLGGIDLSVGPLMSLITAVASFTVIGNNILPGISFCILIGVITGLINGLSIVYLKIPDLVATLITYSAFQGIALIIRPTGGGNISDAFLNFINYEVLGYIPTITLLMILLYIAFEVLLLRSRLGLHLYATGSNSEASYIAGVKINNIKLIAYTMSGLLSAFAGLVLAARIGSGDPQAGTSFTMASITAVVIGGIRLTGGHGVFTGTLLGALLIIFMQNILNLIHVSAYFQYVWVGLLMIVAVGLYYLPQIRGNEK